MNNVDGITGAAPIWHDYMQGALANSPVMAFPVPPGVSSLQVCRNDGGLANPWDAGYTEIFMSDQLPTKHCGTSAPAPVPTPSPTPDPGASPPPVIAPTPDAPPPAQPRRGKKIPGLN